MPFKSKAQRRKFYALKGRGKMSQATINRWERHTPKKGLPERVHRKKHNPPTKGNYLGGVMHRSNRIAW